MILKFKSSALKDKDLEVVTPGQDWTWLDDVAKVQVVEQIDISVEPYGDADYSDVPFTYIHSGEHFNDSHWVLGQRIPSQR